MQAREANAALGVLDERLAGAGSRGERVAAFEAAYRHVAEWRYQVALEGKWTRPGASAEDVRAPLGMGMVYRVTPDNVLSDQDSPAFKMLKSLEKVALERLDGSHGLQNRVRLHSGRRVNGNTVRYIPGPREVRTVTAEPDDREVLRRASFEVLAELEEAKAAGGTDPEQRQAFVDAAYFLVQGPEFKRGSDAIMRTFLVAAHTRVFDAAPVLPQAIDLDGMVRGQEGFKQVMHEQLRIAAPPAAQPAVDAGSERAAVTSLNRGGGMAR
ncbi:hypothetical protein [Kribbella kalugense]|uniref:hypothetical protein n=1 Tax=Kribbella kalugense TaxID=2512221 RepID=UPI001064FECE|nr:hypothetical protein [Kribbella kalugense]